MPPTINPRSQGGQLGERLAARRPQPTPGPRTGYAWGLLVTRMEERVLLPGEAAKTKLVWGRCRNAPRCGSPDCIEAGKCLAGGTTVLPCSRCWDTDKIDANLTIHGPLDAPLGVVCERCGGRDSEVQADLGTPPGYADAMQRIAEWNAMVDQRRERRMGAEEDRRLASLEAEAREMERQAKEMREIRERNEREQGKR